MEKRKQVLLKALREKNEDVRSAAAEALERLELRTRMGELVKQLETGTKIEKLRAVYSLANLRGEKVLKSISIALKDDVEDVRSAAVRALVSTGDRRSLGYLVERLKDPSVMVIRDAVDGLASFGDPQLLSPLMQMLQSKDHGVIEKALDAIARLGDKRSEEAMLYFAGKGNPVMKCFALKALGIMEV